MDSRPGSARERARPGTEKNVDDNVTAADDDVTTSSSLVEYTKKKGYVDVTAEQLQELEKKIVREAQQAAFA